MEQLIIYLHATSPTTPSWAVIDNQGIIRKQAYRDSTEGLATIAENKFVTIIIPAIDVVLTSVQLPKMNRSKLMQAVPYALEEILIDDVEKLHFAVGDLNQSSYPVIIVAKEKMQHWLRLLNEWGIKPNSMIPSMLTLKLLPNVWQLLIDDTAAIRMETFEGFGCDLENLSTLLAVAIDSATNKPSTLIVHNYTEKSLETNLRAHINDVQIEEFTEPATHFMEGLIQDIQSTPSINLLQGSYAVKKVRLTQIKKLWQWTAYLSAAWILLIFLLPIGSYLILSQKASALDSEIINIYKRNFKDATAVIAPRQRMEQKLQKLSTAQGQNRLLVLLGYISKAQQAANGIQLTRFDYQENVLRIEINAPNSQEFSVFSDYLTVHNLKVKQQSAILAGSRINATLEVE